MARTTAQKAKNAAYMRKYSRKNREEINRKQREVYAANPEAGRARTAEWRVKNPEKVQAQAEVAADRFQNDPDHRSHRLYLANKGSAKRRAVKLQRTPAWADSEAMKFFYECRPAGCHVDHRIPLQGENISGFHIETNLQWLPAHLNLSKSNKWEL